MFCRIWQDGGKAPKGGILPSPRPPCRPLWGRCPHRGRRGLPRQKKKSPGGGLGIDFFPYHVILKIKRGAAGRREPPFTKRSNRTVGTVGRLLLFIVVNMDEQSQNAHDELTDQDQFRMSHHMYHLPPRKRRLYKRSVASSRRRGLPPTEYWQRQRISMRRGYYSTFCRIWQSQLRYVLIYVLRLAPGGVLCYGIARKIREVFL